jgi:hypothetical protein
MPTIHEFIESNSLTMTSKRTDHNPSMDDEPRNRMFHWSCNIARRGTTHPFPVTFSMGSAHVDKNGKPKTPELADVLDCLASGAAGYENAKTFDDWAGEYGYDTDSRKAERTFNTIRDQAARLERFLGRDAYNALLWDCERL